MKYRLAHLKIKMIQLANGTPTLVHGYFINYADTLWEVCKYFGRNIVITQRSSSRGLSAGSRKNICFSKSSGSRGQAAGRRPSWAKCPHLIIIYSQEIY